MSRRPTSAGTASLPPQQVRRLVRPSGQVPHHHPSSPARCTYGRGVSLSLARAPSRVNLINPRDRAPTALRPCGVRVSSWRGDAAGGGGQVRGADGRKNPGGGGGGERMLRERPRGAARHVALAVSRKRVQPNAPRGGGGARNDRKRKAAANPAWDEHLEPQLFRLISSGQWSSTVLLLLCGR